MLDRFNAFFAARSRVQLTTASVLLVAVVGAIDYLTGYELSFSIFYLLPVSLASWYLGKSAGVLVSVVSAATWLTVDLMSGYRYSDPAVPVWNATVRLGFFLITAYLLSRLHALLQLGFLLAQRDALTNVLNARAFRDRCDFVFQLAARQRYPVSLAYLDLDNFKGINDSLGHSIGDRVLQAVAASIAERARGSDVVGRLGGDEFAVLLPQTDLSGAKVFFTGIREHLLQLASENNWAVGFSIGVVTFPPPPPMPDDAIKIADNLMYDVKRLTKNDISFQEYVLPCRGA
jgi:diguanylate cyclase (GGDEF)-like protein